MTEFETQVLSYLSKISTTLFMTFLVIIVPKLWIKKSEKKDKKIDENEFHLN